MKKVVLEGYLYPCGHVECRGIILYPKRITMKDFEQAIKYWEEFEKKYHPNLRCIDQDVKLLKESLENNELRCCLITPCSDDKEHGLGPEAIELVKFLEKFKGKKVKIIIEEEGGSKNG